MTYYYANPADEDSRGHLENVEVFSAEVREITCTCGVYQVPDTLNVEEYRCPSCEKRNIKSRVIYKKPRWWYWYCFPGCLPDSDVYGPFLSENKALKDARENME